MNGNWLRSDPGDGWAAQISGAQCRPTLFALPPDETLLFCSVLFSRFPRSKLVIIDHISAVIIRAQRKPFLPFGLASAPACQTCKKQQQRESFRQICLLPDPSCRIQLTTINFFAIHHSPFTRQTWILLKACFNANELQRNDGQKSWPTLLANFRRWK